MTEPKMGRNDVVAVLAKCAAYDIAHFPNPNKSIVDAWTEHFTECFPYITPRDALEAVTEYYREPARRVPQPGDISSIARKMHQDIASRWKDDPAEPYEQIRARLDLEREQARIRMAIEEQDRLANE